MELRLCTYNGNFFERSITEGKKEGNKRWCYITSACTNKTPKKILLCQKKRTEGPHTTSDCNIKILCTAVSTFLRNEKKKITRTCSCIMHAYFAYAPSPHAHYKYPLYNVNFCWAIKSNLQNKNTRTLQHLLQLWCFDFVRKTGTLKTSFRNVR